ncbi:MAG: hypothetical protein LBT55_04020 [Clostridiaceae bacterium]|jgi:hypothetical protein|nr:hypothetical protein [Clostridiaceae bacterium]
MNVKKKRKIIVFVLLALMLVASIMLLAACNPEPEAEPEDPATEEVVEDTLRIKNSDFSRSTSDEGSYPYVPTSWNGVDQSSSLLPQYSTGGIVAGIVNINDAVYEANKSKWNNLPKPSVNGSTDDENMLMIYNSEPSAYAYNSTSFQVTAGAVYKITVDVLTKNLTGNAQLEESAQKYGARIYVSSSTYLEFKQINTNEQWRTYTFYVAGNVVNATSITLQLALGTGTSETAEGLTAGYAFFDNITVTETINISEFQTAERNQTTDNDAAPVRTATLRGNNNGEFNFGSTNSVASYPSLWTGKLGGDDSNSDDKAPSDSGVSRKYGTFDATKWADNRRNYGNSWYDFDKTTDDGGTDTYSRVTKDAGTEYLTEEFAVPTGSFGNNAYMLYQARMSAQALYSNNSIVVERGKWYAISLWIYTKHIYGAGVSIVLKGGKEDIKIEGISETPNHSDIGNNDTNGWEQFTFWISGNQHRNMTYTIEVWLGTGGKADNELVPAPDASAYTSDPSDPNYLKDYEYKYVEANGQPEDYMNWQWKSAVNSISNAPEREYFETYKSTGTFSSGWVFVDNVTLTEYNDVALFEQARDDAKTSTGDEHNNVAELYSLGNTLIENGSFSETDTTGTGGLPAPTDWKVISDDDKNEALEGVDITKVKSGVVNTADTNGDYFADDIWTYTEKNPKTPYEYIETHSGGTTSSVFNVLMIDSREKDAAYKYQSNDFALVKNGYYRLSVWVKTSDIKTTAGIGAYLYKKDPGGDAKKDTLLSSFTKINNTTLSGEDKVEYTNVRTNDWIELVFKIQADTIKDASAYIVLEAGSGTRGTPETLSDGVAFFAYPNLEKITVTDYDGITTGTYTKSLTVTFDDSVTSNTFTNGAFNNLDIKNTKGLGDDGKQTGLDDGKVTKDFGKPKNFSITDTKPGADQLLAGVVDTSNADLLTNLGLTTALAGVYDEWQTSLATQTVSGSPNLLMLSSVDKELAGGGTEPQPIAAGFKSDAFSLSASTYYKLSVWVKTFGNDTKASVILGSENPSNTEGVDPWFIDINTNKSSTESVWTQYIFYIEVGLNSVSNATLSLWLGTDYQAVSAVLDGAAIKPTPENTKSTGTALFDSVELETITQRDYELASTPQGGPAKKISYFTDSFDTVAENDMVRTSVVAPTKWTGQTAVTSLSSADTVAGVADTRYVEIDNVFGLKEENFVDNTEIGDAEKASQISDSKISPEALAAKTGNKLLVINNIKPSAYSYTSNSYSFTATAYYKVSLWIKTAKIADEQGAFIELYLNSDSTMRFTGINTDEWKEYTFYVKTAENSVSPTVKVGLGEFISDDDPSGLVSGYLMVDDVRIDKITKTQYGDLFTETDDGGEKFNLDENFNQVLALESTSSISDGTEEETGDEVGTPREYTWLWISSIVFGAVIIIVVVVYFIKKYRKPRKKDVEAEPSYSKDADGALTLGAKEEKYNEFKD